MPFGRLRVWCMRHGGCCAPGRVPGAVIKMMLQFMLHHLSDGASECMLGHVLSTYCLLSCLWWPQHESKHCSKGLHYIISSRDGKAVRCTVEKVKKMCYIWANLESITKIWCVVASKEQEGEATKETVARKLCVKVINFSSTWKVMQVRLDLMVYTKNRNKKL